MIISPDGTATVYCEGAFNTPNGKTAHGLLRYTTRYRVHSIIDSQLAGADAGEMLEGKPRGIPLLSSIDEALERARSDSVALTHCVIGLAPDGGRLSPRARSDVKRALTLGLNVDSGLHDFLSEDPELFALASERKLSIRDIRKPPEREKLHFFSGRIEEVTSLTVAILGTDSAVGKRTTAWMLVHDLEKAGYRAEMIGTGQTAWMQGARYSIVLDSLVNDFVSGEIEHAVWSAWKEARPDVIVIEGQGSLMNPAFPGGFEILAAGRPDIIILQHAPARRDYDGFPGYPIHSLDRQIQAIELIAEKPVVAVSLSHEGMSPAQIELAIDEINTDRGIPACDVLLQGTGVLIELLQSHLEEQRRML